MQDLFSRLVWRVLSLIKMLYVQMIAYGGDLSFFTNHWGAKVLATKHSQIIRFWV